jgi:hypothetical protein
MKALFNFDQVRNIDGTDYLYRSAVAMRQGSTVCSLPVRHEEISKRVLVHDKSGPVFMMAKGIVKRADVLQVRPRLYVTRGFCQLYCRFLLKESGKIQIAIRRVMEEMISSGSDLIFLLPSRQNSFWLAVAELICTSSGWESARCTLLNTYVAHKGLTHITVDGSVRMLRNLIGQGDLLSSFNHTYLVRDPEAQRRIITVIGRQGQPVIVDTTDSEHSKLIAALITNRLSAEHKKQIITATFDTCSKKLCRPLTDKGVLCNLMVMMLCTVHISMKYEQAHKKSTMGSTWLRRIMSKFTI